MSTQPQVPLSAARLALAIRRFKEERPDAGLLNAEPIAVVGIGCRLPGNVFTPKDFWRILADRVDTITEVPADRWPADDYYDRDSSIAGKTNCRWGGFIEGVGLFDSVAFGISPREAASLDPQQQLLLEVAWETIEDSGRAPESLTGSRTGVFLGISLSDYERFAMQDRNSIHVNTCTGSYRSVASGRVSYLLDVRGPSVTVDTACSSSLVAVHLACQSLRSGESDMALTGGVNLHLYPEHYIGLARLGMMAADGRCKTFDASADGFVPSEGCALVMLKRLSDALADGDRIYAVIRGSAMNQDGRSTSLTAPSGLAQQDVITAALSNASVPPACISFVETHGTGTALGDPIEVEALATVLGAPTEGASPCMLGAAKSNFGHLEAAAGITGLIKTALALYYEQIPGNLHFKELNPHISFEDTRLKVAAQATPWPRAQTPRFAGVSSFGFSGTNAHIVLEDAPRLPVRSIADSQGGDGVLLISARTQAALADAVRSYREFLNTHLTGVAVCDICHASAVQRNQYEERLAITGATHMALHEAIEEYLAGRRRIGIAAGRASSKVGSLVFVCSGQGSQWHGMGVSLLREEPVFRAAMEECDTWIRRWAGWSLLELLSASDAEVKLGDTAYAQPAIFAIQVALVQLLNSWGVTPAAVIGHSAGEIAAAHIVGVLSMSEAARIIVERGRRMQAAHGLGKMVAVRLAPDSVAKELRLQGVAVSIAAVNSPNSTVIAGDSAAVDAITELWRSRSVNCTTLPVQYAFHSPQMEPIAVEMERTLGAVETGTARIPLISTVLGRAVAGTQLDAAYWRRNIRDAVQFSATVETACAMGFETFLEVGPHPVLANAICEHAAPSGQRAEAIGTLHCNQPERTALLNTLGQLHVQGFPVSWNAVYRQRTPPIALPGYPYQRQRFWQPRHTGPQTAPAQVDLHMIFEPEWRSTERGVALNSANGLWIVAGSTIAERAKVVAALEHSGVAARAADAQEWLKSGEQPAGLVWLAPAPCSEDSINGGMHILDTFRAALQELLRRSAAAPVQFFLVTRGVVATPANREISGLFLSPLWGMLRSVAIEHPELSCVRIDLSPAVPDFEALAETIAHWDGEEEIALHGGQRYAPRLEPGSFAAPVSLPIREDATYLITGGLGAIGLHCLEWLMGKGARSVVLVSRRRPTEEAATRIEAARAHGVRIEIRSADISDVDQTGAILNAIEREMLPLKGVFHAAGVLDDGVFLDQTAERFANVLAPKAIGAWNLHSLLAGKPLDCFVLFSSVASLTGSPGQSGYSAANAFLDVLAHARHSRGLPALSINWGAWADSGMAANVAGSASRRVLAALRPMTAEQCFAALECAMAANRPQLAIANADWNQWNPVPRLLELVTSKGNTKAGVATENRMLHELASAAPNKRRRILVAYLRDQVTSLLRLDGSGRFIDEAQSLLRLGMDSLMALEYRNLLAAAFGRPLSATLVFDHPTLGDLADFFIGPSAPENTQLRHDATLEELEGLSDEQAEELLKTELNRI